MEIAAGMGALGRVFGFRRGEGVGSRPVSSHRRDAEVAEKSEKKILGAFCVSTVRTQQNARVGQAGFQFGRKRKVGPPRSGVSMAVF